MAGRGRKRTRGRPRLTPSTLPPGCRRHGRGIQATVTRHGQSLRASFPLDTPNLFAEIAEWRKQAIADLAIRFGRGVPVAAGTLASDARRYLRAVKALRSYKQRAADIALWVALFGDRRRQSIRPIEIRAVRDQWLTVGPRRTYVKDKGWTETAKGLSPQTVCLRMRALENLYTVLDGPHGYNPVRNVQEPATPKAKPRAVPYELLERILAAMPDRGRAMPGEPRPSVSKTKARLRLIPYTGLTQSQIAKLTPESFRLDSDPPLINRPPRGKGTGSEGGWKPAPAEARPAIEAFIAADAFGPFSGPAMWKSFRRACKRLKLTEHVTPYQLRHSFGTAMLRKTGDLEATRLLMDHATTRTTLGYAQAEVDAWLLGVVAKVTGFRPVISAKPDGETESE